MESPEFDNIKDFAEFSKYYWYTKAGSPLVAIERMVDTVPLSGNENMAGFMH